MKLATKLLLTTALLAIPTFAAPIVTYTTSGLFSTTGSSSATFGSGTLNFTPGGGTVDLGLLNPSNGNLGTIVASGFSPSALSTISGLLTVNINQTLPSGGNGNLIGTLSGSLTFDSSSARVLFTTASVTLPGTVTYTISQPVDGILIVPPSTNSGQTTLQGIISAPVTPSDVPEPGMFGLIGTALVGLGFVRRRRMS